MGEVLVIGGTGMLGRAMTAALTERGVAFGAPGRTELDLLNSETIGPAVAGARVVINCAAWTDVDGAEADEAGATRLNGKAVGVLAAACRRQGAALVHFGTDYVFDGAGTAPYPTDAPIRPLNAYGRSKAAGEAAIGAERKRGLRALVIRTSWLYAPWGKNFVRTIAGLARQKPRLRVVADQRGRPTSCLTLADATARLIGPELAGRWPADGLLHVTDGGETTWFEFACRIAEFSNPACAVEPCTTAEFPRPARRPAYSVLDLSRAEELLGPMPDWRAALDEVLPRLEL